jgi:hypothetical protein
MSPALSLTSILTSLNVLASSILAILAFSLLAYTLTYNFRNQVARRYALVLLCVMIVYTGDVALDRVATAESAARWLRVQWLGIAGMPAAAYLFSVAVLATTNFRIGRRRWIALFTIVVSTFCAVDALFGRWIVGDVRFAPPLSYLEAGPLFWLFAVFFGVTGLLALGNIWKARQRCLTQLSRQRMTYLLLGFVAPGIGVFPYLIAVSRMSPAVDSSIGVLLVSLAGNVAVGFMLLLVGYTVAYFGVLTPDRVVRYRLLRFFMRGPVVAILVIAAILVVPKVERILGLPRDVVLFGVITGVIIFSQLFLSVTKTLVDRLIYREDRDEIAWLRELDRRLLATTDLRQLLENNLIALCELLRVPSGFVAAAVGPDLILEAVVGPDDTRSHVLSVGDWSEALSRAMRGGPSNTPYSHQGFWVWPLTDTISDEMDEQTRVFGVLGVAARTDTPLLSLDERQVLDTLVLRVTRALADRKLQQSVLSSLRYLIPDIEEVQQLRGLVPYAAPDSMRDPSASLMDPSPIHNPEFEPWVKEALSHYWGGPKLTRSPLIRLRVVSELLSEAEDDPTKALRLVLGQAMERLRPEGKQNFTAPEWLLYNILEMRFIQGRKVREIADRLAMSESDLYRKQRVAIGQLARVLTEMEQENSLALEPANGAAADVALPVLPAGGSNGDARKRTQN